MELTIEQKDKIYDLISSKKSIIIYKKMESDKILSLNEIINEIGYDLHFKSFTECFLFLTKHWDKKCRNTNCSKDRIITSLFPNRNDFLLALPKHGVSKFCSKACAYLTHSENQMGVNNSSHKMSEETFRGMCLKNSIKMKANIRDGKFIPPITNSWAKSRCDIKFYRDYELIEIKTRSTWEAYFQLFNTNLFYEKMVIPYNYNNNYYNYIIDFVDYNSKILYEIKPLSNINDDKVKAKTKYAKKWCKLNGYKFIFITDKWFLKNYNECIVIGQPSESKIIKNLKQFKNENKKNKKNRLC